MKVDFKLITYFFYKFLVAKMIDAYFILPHRCQGVVPVFTVDNTVKHEMPTGPQSPTSPGMNFPREPG